MHGKFQPSGRTEAPAGQTEPLQLKAQPGRGRKTWALLACIFLFHRVAASLQGAVLITNSGFESPTIDQVLATDGSPTISSVSPKTLRAVSGGLLVISGAALDRVTRVELGSTTIAPPFRFQAWDKIVLEAPPRSPGTTDVLVAGSTGTNVLRAGLEYIVPVTFFVATNGSDSNPGTQAAPFRTIQRAVNLMPPSSICYVRGGRYHETVTGPLPAGVKIAAYPSEEVTLDGTEPITNAWTRYNGSIYKTTLPKDIWQLFYAGEMMIPARWPNASFDDASVWNQEATWAHGDTASSYGNMVVRTDGRLPNLAATGKDLTGAMAVLNIGRYLTFSRYVQSHTSGANHFMYPTNGPPDLEQPFMWDPWFKEQQRFYLECHLNCLDTAKEWYYNPATKELFFWAPDGQIPAGEIRGKTMTYAFDLDGAEGDTVAGFKFFAATFRLLNTRYSEVKDCEFDHYAFNKRMLSVEDRTVSNGYTQWTMDTRMRGPYEGSFNTIRNSTFAYSDGGGFAVEGANDLVENILLHDIDWSGVGKNTLDLWSSRMTARRISVFTTGASECLAVGPLGLVELCDLGAQLGVMQHDGANIQVWSGVQDGVEVRNCWVHDNWKFGIRADVDGPNVVYPQGYGTNMLVHHNVVWGMTSSGESPGIAMAGDFHKIYNNLSLPDVTSGIMLDSAQGVGNLHSVTRNNLTGPCGIGIGRIPNCFDSAPGVADHNWEGDIATLLADFANRDFRPKPGSLLVDAGTSIPGITDGYLRAAPDIGAYEYGDNTYWIPGYQTSQAREHVPTNGAVVNATNVDLIWLGGYQGVSYDVYFGENPLSVAGANHGSPEFKRNQTNNIFRVNGVAVNRIYYWRVDTIQADGGVVVGETWALTTHPPLPPPEPSIVNGSFESPTIDEAIAMGNPGYPGVWADNVHIDGWLGTAGVNKLMVVDGNQNLYWNDPQGKSVEQTLSATVSAEIGRTYTVEYTRQINAQPSIKILEFRAELLIGGQVVDFERYTNVSVPCGQHRLSYTTDGSRSGQSITIRFSANADKGWTQPWEIQSIFIDQVQVTPGLPPKATLVSPSGTINTNKPTYKWNNEPSATYYQLYVNDSGTKEKIKTWYTGAEADCSSGTCSVTPSTTLAIGNAQWWIQTWNTTGFGPWSDGMSFTVTGGPPGKATLVSPSGSITTTTPTYVWNAVSGSTWYYLWVNDAAGSGKIKTWYTAEQAGCAPGTGNCSVTPSTALASGAAQWWIQTWNDSGEGPWSDGMAFSVGAAWPPGKATLISPSGTISTATPAYSWNAVTGATWYQLWVQDSVGSVKIQSWYTSAQTDCASGTGTCTVTPTGALAIGSYQWWIQTWNDSGYGPWSTPLSFTVAVSQSGGRTARARSSK